MASVTAIPAGSPPARLGLTYWMDRVLKQLDRVRSSPDPDAVHDARVAIRRCRSLATVLREVDPYPAWAEMKKLPQKLFRALGTLRDTQVLEAWVKHLAPEHDPLREKLLRILEEREARSRDRALRAASKFDAKAWKRLGRVLRQRAHLVPADGLAARCLALERYVEAHELHSRALRTEKPKPWHALRIGLKRFRYTVENLLPGLYVRWEENLKRVQDLLGDLHDLDVLAALVKAESPGIAPESVDFLQQAIERKRKERIEIYRQRTLGHSGLWHEWRSGLPHGPQLEAAAMARLRATARAMDPRPRRTSQISRLALRVFDALAASGCAPAFRQRTTRRILRAAARLHGIGAAGPRKSPQKSARAVLRGLPIPPGWKREEWELLAWTVRYHRGAEPKPKHRAFASLPEDRRNLVRGLAGVLRLARALRRCGADSPDGIRAEAVPNALRLRVPGLVDSEGNAARLAAGKHLLELYFGKPLLIEPLEKVVALPPADIHQPTVVAAASD